MQTEESVHLAIGRFIAEFSQLEYTLRHYLAEEIKLDDMFFHEIVGSYDAGLLLNVCRAVFQKTRGKRYESAIKGVLTRFQNMIEERNRVAHALWVVHLDGGTHHHINRNSLKSLPAANRADALNRLADEISEIRASFERAVTSL